MSMNHWILQSIAMAITALLLPKLRVTSLLGPLAAVFALAFINTTLWDAALFFRIPDSLSIHFLTLIFCNAAIFWIVVKLVPGIEISGLMPALLAPLVFSVVSVVLHQYGAELDWARMYTSLSELTSEVKDFLFNSLATANTTETP